MAYDASQKVVIKTTGKLL